MLGVAAVTQAVGTVAPDPPAGAAAGRVAGRPRAGLPMTTVLLVGIFAVAYILNATELIQRVQAATGGVAAVAAPAGVDAESSPAATHDSRTLRGG